MAVQDIIKALASIEREIAGVKRAYDETPDSLSEFPCFINYPWRGVLEGGAWAGGQAIHTIVAELRIGKKDTRAAEEEARKYIKRVWKKIAENDSLLDTVSTVIELRYQYGRMPPMAGEDHIGIRFELDVKEQDTDVTFES